MNKNMKLSQIQTVFYVKMNYIAIRINSTKKQIFWQYGQYNKFNFLSDFELHVFPLLSTFLKVIRYLSCEQAHLRFLEIFWNLRKHWYPSNFIEDSNKSQISCFGFWEVGMDFWQYWFFDISYFMFQLDIQLSKFHNAQSCEPKLARHLDQNYQLYNCMWVHTCILNLREITLTYKQKSLRKQL